MLSYAVRRVALAIPAVVALSVLVFCIMRVLPGDVALVILGSTQEQTFSRDQLNAVRQELGLDKPLPTQYVDWISGLVRLSPGRSLWNNRPVGETIVDRLPVTVELALLTVLLSAVVALPAGVLSGAVYHGRWPDKLISLLTVGGLAMPGFWLGALVILALARIWHWLPPLEFQAVWSHPLTNLQQVIFPALVLAASSIAVITRMLRSSLLEVIRQDYIRTAQAKGLKKRTVITHHAMKNAMLPVATVMGLQFGALLGGTVLIETVFNLPGIGSLLVQSITRRDYPVVQTLVMLFGCTFVVVNLLVDLSYSWLDPRIQRVQ